MSNESATLDQKIDLERNKIRTDKLDITYGELASMYEGSELGSELVIAPAYQRLFRWSLEQQTKFIESILLGFPTPAIFVAETDEGIWELVDGLQRVSTVLQFLGVLKSPEGSPLPPTELQFEGKKHALLPSLDGVTFSRLTLRSQLSIKRASCRVEVIKTGSASNMKYAVFERLNTGGEGLTEQEVRNCIFRAQKPEFMDFVDRLAEFEPFSDNLSLSEFQKNSMYDKGLVLRFFALKNRYEAFEHDVEPFITEYAREIIEGQIPFDLSKESEVFKETFSLIAQALEDNSWRHFRDGRHKGPFSVYVFDALSVGVANNIDIVRGMSTEDVRERCLRLKQNPDFVANTGAGANIKSRMSARMQAAMKIFGEHQA